MLSRLGDLPLLVLLIGISALAMLIPALFGWSVGDTGSAQDFLFSAVIFAVVFVLMGFATASYSPKRRSVGHLASLVLSYVLLPLVLAVPFADAVPDTRYLNAYVEMVSALTTTGATLFEQTERLPDTVHLWRALVGWLGGFLVWVTAAAILAPLQLGGFEVRTAGNSDRQSTRQTASVDGDGGESSHRMRRFALRLAPIYAGLTLALWIILMAAGDAPFPAVSHAMSTLATSGISPSGGPSEATSGFVGELAIFAFLVFALTRLTFSRDVLGGDTAQLVQDPELRMGLALVVLVPVGLFLRHWIGALEVDAANDPLTALAALWGGVFTVMSFLTTTGFESASWEVARNWSGLATPGLILMGLALVGGRRGHNGRRRKTAAGLCALQTRGPRDGASGHPGLGRGRRPGCTADAPPRSLLCVDFLHAVCDFDCGGDAGVVAERSGIRTRVGVDDRELVDHRPACEHRDRSADQLCPLVTRSQSHPECRHDPWPVGNPGLDRIAEPRLLARIDHRCRVWPIFGLVTGPRAPHSLGRGWIKSGPTGTAKRKKGPEYNG